MDTLDQVRVAHDMIQQIADAIEGHADGLSMDDENDRRRMAEWIAENFDPPHLRGLTVADGSGLRWPDLAR